MRLYAGSDGNFYTDAEVGYRIETGTWHSRMWDPDAGWHVVETGDLRALWLVPVEEGGLPAGVGVESTDGEPTIDDTRGS